MNGIYKVIYSKARQCCMVVSELAKSSHKNSRKGAGHVGTPALARMVAAALAAGALTWGIAPGVSLAADKDIVEKGALPIHYDISPANDGTNIAVGKNAKVFIGGGTQESMLSFGEKADLTMWHGLIPTGWNIHSNPHAKRNLPEAIAVGTNSYARTGSIEIGAHTLAENKIAIGDTTADQLQQFGVASTTLGTNSYTGGGFATTIGSYNVQSNPYDAKNVTSGATKNAFATVIGTFNSNESLKSDDSASGVANMISGTANKVTNSNGAIVMGAGNSVKNSIGSFDTSSYSNLFGSAADMQKALMDGVAKSAGGATLVIGGANSAEKTQNSQIMGVGNSMKSTTYKKVQYNYLDGFNSSITDASHVKVLGQNVTINKGADSNTVIGDYRTVAENQTNNVIIGNADEKNPSTTEKKETVILGYKANATVEGGVALGSGSIAEIGAEVFGWDPKTNDHWDPKTNEKSITDEKAWKSSWAAVSVGDSTHTRQITNVAAGFNDTDAVNVAQLKKAMENAAPKIDFVAGDGIQIEKDSTGTKYTIKAYITGGTTTTDITKVTPKEGSSSGTGSSGTTSSGKPLEITTETNPISFAADEGTVAKVKPSEKERLGILGDKTNISTKVDGSNITVSLKKDITVDSVKAGNTTVDKEGVTITGGPSMTVNGMDAGGKKITNVADGTDASDAVNYGQLQNVENKVDQNTQNITYLNGRVGELGDRINKVGAGAAALAALHPLDFDPDDKWDFAAGVGNYRNATAAAVGLFYRPNERTMFNLGWTMGDNRNMVNGGFSVKFGKSNKYVKYSKAEMASVIDNQSREIAELKAKDAQNAKDNAEMRAEIEALKKQVEALAAKK